MSLPGAGETEPTTTSFLLSSDHLNQSQTIPSSSTSTSSESQLESEPVVTIVEPIILTSEAGAQFRDDNNNTETITDFEVIKADDTDNSDGSEVSVLVTDVIDDLNTTIDSTTIPTSNIVEAGTNDNDQTNQNDTITIIPKDNNEYVLDKEEIATNPSVFVVLTQCADYIPEENEPLISVNVTTTTTNQTNENKNTENTDLHNELVKEILSDLNSDGVKCVDEQKQQTDQVNRESVQEKSDRDLSETFQTREIKVVTVGPSGEIEDDFEIDIVEKTVKFVEKVPDANVNEAKETGDDKEIRSILKSSIVTSLDAKKEEEATKANAEDNKYFDYSLYRESSSSPPPKPLVTYRWEDVKRDKEKVRSR